jgi:hypothetical protein
MSRTASAVAVVLLVVGFVVSPSAGASSSYTPPVDGPVIDPFRAPPSPYAAGNRGLEYATTPGELVRAAADGTVVFAGNVAGTLHVTVVHADGLRTSYSFLREVAVRAGDVVRQGEPVGSSLDRLHFGVRDRSGDYIDPASLFGEVRVARLVPGVDEGEPPLVDDERRDLLALVAQQAALGRLAASHERATRLALHYAIENRPEVRAARMAARFRRLEQRRNRCTRPDEPAPVLHERHIALLVGGLGSSSTDASVDRVDAATLGFAPEDVLRFSYAGGRVPDASDGAAFAPLAARGYEPSDTTNDLEQSAERLADLVLAVAAAQPGVPIDVVAHSQGGVVARRAIARLVNHGRLPPEVASLAMLATPQAGADLATAGDAANHAGVVPRVVLDRLGIDVDAPAVRQLSEVSTLADVLRADPLPSRLKAVSIAARGDFVVSVPNAMADDVPIAVVPLAGARAHGELPSFPATTRELALALAGEPPTCVSDAVAAADLVVGEAISWATDAAGGAFALGAPSPP